MSIFVMTDRSMTPLYPIGLSLEPAMLPIGGRPLIEHLLGALAAEVKDITIVSPPEHHATRNFIKSTVFPTLNLTVVASGSTLSNEACLLIRGDMWIDPKAVKSAVGKWRAGEPPASPAEQGIIHRAKGELAPHWPQPQHLVAVDMRMSPLARRHAISSTADFHALALDAAAGKVDGLQHAGWLSADGLRTNLDARILTRLPIGPECYVGKNSIVDRDVRLIGRAIVNDNCVIGKGTQIFNSVILPGVCVGAGLNIQNAVVGGNWIYNVNSGAVVDIGHTNLLREMVA